MKEGIFFIEKQLEMPGGAKYLPLASGLLAAFAKKYLPGHKFNINVPDRIDEPDAVAFSVSSWNLNYSILNACEIRHRHPDCRIVFGGPSVSVVEEFNKFDTIEGEGEVQFLKWLANDIPIPEITNLDDIPSPYLTGLFDNLITPNSQAIVETNRGCSFGCAYCFWGKGNKGIKFHSLEYVKAEAEWMGINKIKYIFCADGNFGMFPQDIEIAKIYAKVKQKYGYPEKFRVCYGKNAEKSIFETAKILSAADLAKTVTLSPQSRNSNTLEAVGRRNIKDSFFEEMQKKYSDAGIPVYSELILGLPEETYDSFKDGLIKTMQSGNQLFIYLCESLPGTKLAEKEYQLKYGITTSRVLLTPVHCRPTQPQEYEDIVVGTRAMPIKDWKKAVILGWMVQLYYSFKLTAALPEDIIEFCIHEITADTEMVQYLRKKADDILAGKGRCDLIDGVYFEPEEILYLKEFSKPGTDPVTQIIHARKDNFRKDTPDEDGCLHPIASSA